MKETVQDIVKLFLVILGCHVLAALFSLGLGRTVDPLTVVVSYCMLSVIELKRRVRND